MAAHAPEDVHQVLVDVQVYRIDGIAADIDAQDFSEDDFAGGSDLEGRVTAAFEGCWGGEDARAADHLAGCGGQSCFVEFIDLGSELDGADFHLSDQSFVADMDRERACFTILGVLVWSPQGRSGPHLETFGCGQSAKRDKLVTLSGFC